MATSQGTHRAPKSWKPQEGPFPRASEGANPLISHLFLPEPGEHICGVISTPGLGPPVLFWVCLRYLRASTPSLAPGTQRRSLLASPLVTPHRGLFLAILVNALTAESKTQQSYPHASTAEPKSQTSPFPPPSCLNPQGSAHFAGSSSLEFEMGLQVPTQGPGKHETRLHTAV